MIDQLSDVFDIRNWSMIAFDPSDKSNENDEAFKEYLLSMRKKILTNERNH